MIRSNTYSTRHRRSRRRGRGALSPSLGWMLLLLGLVLLIWRLRVDFTSQVPIAAVQHPTPVVLREFARSVGLPDPVAGGTTAAALPIRGGAGLDAQLLDAILAAYHSPLQGHGADLVSLSRRYRVDDAVALAFFVMESRAGTLGTAIYTHNIGNLRPMSGADAAFTYRDYGPWLDGAAAWFRLMRELYLDKLKLTTVETAVPIYAPYYDGNDPYSMTMGIRQLVQCWRGTVAACPDDPPGVGAIVAAAHARASVRAPLACVPFTGPVRPGRRSMACDAGGARP